MSFLRSSLQMCRSLPSKDRHIYFEIVPSFHHSPSRHARVCDCGRHFVADRPHLETFREKIASHRQLIDHLVRAKQDGLGHFETECRGSLAVKDKLEF